MLMEINGQVGLSASLLPGGSAPEQGFPAGQGKNFKSLLEAVLQGGTPVGDGSLLGKILQTAGETILPPFFGEEGEKEDALLFLALTQGFLHQGFSPSGISETSPEGGDSGILLPEIPEGALAGERMLPVAGRTGSSVELQEETGTPLATAGEKLAREAISGLTRAENGPSGMPFQDNNSSLRMPVEKAGERLLAGTGGEGKQPDTPPVLAGENRLLMENQWSMISDRGGPPSPEPVSFGQVVDQLVQSGKLKLLGQKSQVEIKLKPEHLGRLEMRLTLAEGVLTARFLVENQQVGRLLDGNLSNLRQTLEEQGLKFDQVQVEVGNFGAFSRQGEDPWSGKPPASWQAGSLSGEQETSIPATSEKGAGWGIDYRA
ncbi:MAG TPA: flagellar hook-length control protein FliK [Clostridia bacterium]|nr:flagellar hook-length control protein FliK [Clostridia bacterium]